MRRVTPGARFDESPRRLAGALLLSALAFVVYINGHLQQACDSIPTSLVAVTLVSEGSVRLDRFSTGALAERWGVELPYFLVRTPHGVVSRYPIATSILASAAMAPAVLTPTASTKDLVDAAHRQEQYAAALFTAASVVVFALLCWELGFGDWLTVGLTIFYAFGSQAFNTSSQLLWQHGPGVLFILLTFLSFARLRVRTTRLKAVCFALAWAVAVAIRPMNILLVVPLVALALYRLPRVAAYTLLPAIAVGLPVAAYNLHFFGTLLGGYITEPPFVISRLGSGAAGLLLSPGRGLFLYFPIAAVALVLAIGRRVLTHDIGRAALAGVILPIVLFASYEHWHGGLSVGPRYMTEAEALLLVLLGVAWQTLPQHRKAPLAILCFGILLPYCLFIQVVTTYSAAPSQWNFDRVPDSVAALWDFRDNPISHAFR
jgi:hypothetical protein